MEGLPWLLEAGQGDPTLSLSLQEESALLTSGFASAPRFLRGSLLFKATGCGDLLQHQTLIRAFFRGHNSASRATSPGHLQSEKLLSCLALVPWHVDTEGGQVGMGRGHPTGLLGTWEQRQLAWRDVRAPHSVAFPPPSW